MYANNRRLREGDDRISLNRSDELFELQKGKCACCADPLGDDYHLDHITPLSGGGRNIDGNTQLLRAACNLKKGRRDPIDYMQSLGKLI